MASISVGGRTGSGSRIAEVEGGDLGCRSWYEEAVGFGISASGKGGREVGEGMEPGNGDDDAVMNVAGRLAVVYYGQ